MPINPRSKNRDIRIFNIAKTTVDRYQVRLWLDDLGAQGYQVPNPTVATDAALLVALAAKQCYMSFEPGLNPNVTKVRSDMATYLDNILKSGHGSVLEHVSWTFAINGVSRVFTGEMNRHRAGWAISERSMRYIRFGDCIEWALPRSLQALDTEDAETYNKVQRTKEIFHQAFGQQSELYAELVDLWALDNPNKDFKYKKHVTSALRRIVGMGCATGGVWTGNARALRHVLTMRCSEAAEEEIHYVFCQIAQAMVQSEPMLFGDFEEVPVGRNVAWVPKYEKV